MSKTSIKQLTKPKKKQGNLSVAEKNKELSKFYEFSKLTRANFEMMALKTKMSNEDLLIFFDVSLDEMNEFCMKHFKKSYDNTMNRKRILRFGRYSLLNDTKVEVDGNIARDFFKGEGIIEEQRKDTTFERIFIVGSIEPTEILNPKKPKLKKDEK
jgi:hypothetical protein